MYKFRLMTSTVCAFILWSIIVWAGPTQLTDSQMTDMSVTDTVVNPNEVNENTVTPNAKLDSKKKQSVIGQIKNPVDDPAVLNQAELLRLEKQAADQRVNDQIQNSLQGIPNP